MKSGEMMRNDILFVVGGEIGFHALMMRCVVPRCGMNRQG